ncbi:MAG: ABC transporter ATP-binding protein/permease [Defluviitaleaceae bacterium]|nr:ABC transporter ATP-binding protein/permease [Defluviitaleaceae bacterium]
MNKKNDIKYSHLNTLKYAIRNLWKWNKGIFFSCMLQIPCNLIIPFVSIMFVSSIVEMVNNSVLYSSLILYIAIYSIILIVFSIILNICKAKVVSSCGSKIRLKYELLLYMKSVDMDYELIEDPKTQESFKKAKNATEDIMSGTQKIVMNFVSIISSFINVAIYAVVVYRINPLLLLVLTVPILVEFYIKKMRISWYFDKRNNWIPIDRKLDYITNKTGQIEWGKDIRLYDMLGFTNSIFNKEFVKRIYWLRKENKRNFLISLSSIIMTLIRDGISYIYLIFQILFREMLASDFVFLFASLNLFSTNFMLFFESVNEYLFIHRQFCDFRNFLSIENTPSKTTLSNALNDTQYEIEFVNVSYTFLGCNEPVLKNISFKISKGQKVAIIGENGAGKTTLIKLMCGLYKPTEGHILLNGQDIKNYDTNDVFSLFSPVFQDMYFLPASIEKNVTMQTEEQIDYTKLNQIAQKTGFSEVVSKLKNRWKTNLIKIVHNDAVNLSGGEQQRLALSRSLYKEGKILILDEPTAALDPIIEKKIYMQYDEMTENKTSIFISHRLASTSFCNMIFVLNNGQIVEKGSHEALLNNSEIYKTMFFAQSHYYKDEVEV